MLPRGGVRQVATDPSRLQLMRLLHGRLLRQQVFEVASAVNYGSAVRSVVICRRVKPDEV